MDLRRKIAKNAVQELKGSICEAVAPHLIQVWNKISEADSLKCF